MAIKLVVAVTDHEWFELLRQKPDLTEVNFWAPSGANFKALEEGELFLFSSTRLTISSWEAAYSLTQTLSPVRLHGRLLGRETAREHCMRCARADGLKLWDEVSDRISRTDFNSSGNAERFGEPRLVKPRLARARSAFL